MNDISECLPLHRLETAGDVGVGVGASHVYDSPETTHSLARDPPGWILGAIRATHTIQVCHHLIREGLHQGLRIDSGTAV